MSIDEAGPLCACSQPFSIGKTSRLITPTTKPRMSLAAAVGLFAALLCAGCIGPFHASKKCDPCSEAVNDGGSCETGASCETPATYDCVQQPCCHEGFTWRMGRKCLHVICWPRRVCCGALNFCAHNESVGPPDIQAPGRFHPVPTHPVFAPVSEPVANPEQL